MVLRYRSSCTDQYYCHIQKGNNSVFKIKVNIWKLKYSPLQILRLKVKIKMLACLDHILYFELFDLRTIKFFLQKTYRTLFGLLFTQVAIYCEKLSNWAPMCTSLMCPSIVLFSLLRYVKKWRRLKSILNLLNPSTGSRERSKLY